MSVKMSSGIGREEIFLSAKHPTFSNCVKQLSAKIKTFQVLGYLRMAYTLFLVHVLDSKMVGIFKTSKKSLKLGH